MALGSSAAAAIFVLAIGFFAFAEEVYDNFLLAHIQPDFITYRLFCDFFTFFGFESDFCAISFADKKLQSIKVTSQLMNSHLDFICFRNYCCVSVYITGNSGDSFHPVCTRSERRQSRGFISIASLLFFLGVAFSFYVIAPISINFLYNYQITDAIQNNFTLESHIGLVTNMILGVSMLFELPVIIYFLAKIGIVTPAFLKKYRKHALVFVLIIAAIITPPDVASQIIVSIPVLILYEISIKVAAIVIKRQQKNAK